MTPRATYRLQFTPDFGFDAAARIAPYLARLGISRVDAAPYFGARPGSRHGYDIVDHNELNPELGDRDAFDRMVVAFAANGLKQILDFVPNHMGVGGSDNPAWLDVLEWGPDADHAGWFDIDWRPDRNYLRDKLLVPFLGRQYGEELEAGHLALKFDTEAGAFAVWAYDTHKLPISPLHYERILGTAHPALERIGDAFAHLAEWRPQVVRRADALKAELAMLVGADPEVATAVAAAVSRFRGRPDAPASWARLDRLIKEQFWRPASFRVAADDINYRRFFNIAELAGLRMELPTVFDEAHRLVFALMANGTVDGLRIDHVDGLLDPNAYLQRLRAKAPAGTEAPFYLVVEKILGEGEPLREDWPVDGTTGYEVTNLLLGVLMDPAGEAGFTQAYAVFIGTRARFDPILRKAKKRIMDNEMASELATLAREAGRIALQTNRTSDFTRNVLRRAIREIVACFPVYRTYVDASGQVTATDRSFLAEAIALARVNETAIDPSVYDFLERLLTGDLVAQPDSGFSRSAVLRCAMKLQQYSGPVMAKGMEDTAFYRYNRFIALNEVGGHPQHFAVTVEAFHAANRERAERWRRAMLATSTHDTKRGEDARARLAVLSEFPEGWATEAGRWRDILDVEDSDLDEDKRGPDANDLYALLQTLVGTWPVDLLDPGRLDRQALEIYAGRVKGAMTKFMREAKVHSTWASPNEAYESATLALVDAALTGERAPAFLPAFVPFAARIARLGVANSLVQTVLKLTLPGMPDMYQGADFWDLSMVDPDNRRPVDYAARDEALAAVSEALTRDRAGTMRRLAAKWQDGHIKLAVIATLLGLRKTRPSLFADGRYVPLVVEGREADAVIGFERALGADRLCIAVARFPGRRDGRMFAPGTRVAVPAGGWTDALTGRSVASDGWCAAADLFAALPAVVLLAGTPPA